VLCFPAAVRPEETVEELYAKVREEYRALAREPRKHTERGPWEATIEKLHAVMERDLEGRLTDKCLFVIAQVRHHLYSRHRSDQDAREAVHHYRLVVHEYPQSPLADDAQFLLGVFFADELRDPQRAQLEFARVGLHFPHGDMVEKAARKLTALGATASPAIQAPPATAGSEARASAAAGSGMAPRPRPVRIESIRFQSEGQTTHMVMFTTGPVKVEQRALEDPQGATTRVRIELQDCVLGTPVTAPQGVAARVLENLAVIQAHPSRVVVRFVLAAGLESRLTTHGHPHRVTVEVREKPAAGQAARAPVTAARGKPAPGPTLAQQLGLNIGRIVIDPGHGGKDTGAVSRSGLYEKDVVLALAKSVKGALEAETGCQVMLTRTGDATLSLEERTAFANAAKADLFLSIHANAHENVSLGGVETYFLSFASDAAAASLAALENATAKRRMSDLESMLQELVRNSNTDESARLARSVQRQVVVKLRERYRSVRDLGVKQAPFVVLLGAEMPAILIETAFLTNGEEERRLQEKGFQAILGRGVAAGVSGYLRQMKKFARAGEER
jgi:N-acetylmuramoyl-L-alanine amidase